MKNWLLKPRRPAVGETFVLASAFPFVIASALCEYFRIDEESIAGQAILTTSVIATYAFYVALWEFWT